MKKLLLSILAAGLCASAASAQGFFDRVPFRGAMGTDNWAGASWTNWNPQSTIYPGDAGSSSNATRVDVNGDITANTTWTANNYYVLDSATRVRNGATLTIEPGTVIRSRNNNGRVPYLLIAKGSKLNARGTAANPIVFTSLEAPGARSRGDWGGILVIGNAHVNTQSGDRQYEALPNDTYARYGGGATPNDDDSSGVMAYIRCEFAGYSYLPNQELNSITFGAVGRRTEAHHLMCSFGRDDSFEWFGGTVNHKYLIAFAGTDDDIDCDEGYSGMMQYVLGVRHPRVWETAPTGASNGLEHDNNTALGGSAQVNPSTTNPRPITSPIIANMTIVGPIKPGETRTSLASGQLFSRGILIRTNAATSVYNSVVMGYANNALEFGHSSSVAAVPSTQSKAQSDSLAIRGVTLIPVAGRLAIAQSGLAAAGSANNPNSFSFNQRTWFQTAGWANDTLAAGTAFSAWGMVNPQYTGAASDTLPSINFTNANYSLEATSPLLTGAVYTGLISNLVNSTSDLLAQAALTVYPNPANGTAFLQVALPQAGEVSINIIDRTGKSIRQVGKTAIDGTQSISLPVQGLTPGLYLVRVSQGTSSRTLKLSVR